VWQTYTKWQLIMMHETIPGKRIRNYIELSQEAFGTSMPPLLHKSSFLENVFVHSSMVGI
jgi:hypothetical protein